MKLTNTLPLALVLLASACTNTDNPQLAMCQAVAKQLTSNTISEWGDTSQSNDNRSVTVKVGFTNSSSQAGSLDCLYKKSGDGTVQTAPYKVALNGQAVDGKQLISAGTKASKELLTGAYKNTVAKSQELAAEASVVAGEALDAASKVAKEVATEVSGQVENALQNGSVLKLDK